MAMKKKHISIASAVAAVAVTLPTLSLAKLSPLQTDAPDSAAVTTTNAASGLSLAAQAQVLGKAGVQVARVKPPKPKWQSQWVQAKWGQAKAGLGDTNVNLAVNAKEVFLRYISG